MKTIKIENGEVRIGYEFNDLPEDIRKKVLMQWINIEIETMNENSPYWYLAEKMEQMQTPWFLGSEIYEHHKDDIIETILINEFLFDEDGKILPITTHVGKDNKPIKHTFGRRELNCEII